MNLSFDWLKDYINLEDIDIKEFAEKMTMSGSKVEKIEFESDRVKNLENIVTGKIVNIKNHPNADKLIICEVDVNNKENLQIVTGAKNLKVNDIVPVALHGSILANGVKIKKGKLRGIESNGMLCSLSELGLSLNDFPYASEDGIFVIQEENCPLGQDIKKILNFKDIKIEFEITLNRPDCLSVIGLAREAGAVFNKNLKNLEIKDIKRKTCEEKNKIKVKIEEKDLCPVYCACVVENVKIEPSPAWLRKRLNISGVRSINNIVDITNYVMLEYGQPMHAFDINFIENNEIIIRKARKNERFVTLDNIEKNLLEDNLVVCDKVKPMALAGIKGGLHSGIHEDTSCIVFESANFNCSSVRKTAKDHELRTESSLRFEKGLDPENCIFALKRALELIEILKAGDVTDCEVIKNYIKKEEVKIDFDINYINNFLNINILEKEAEEILKRNGCVIKNKKVIVPSFRKDLKIKQDIAEEIARFYGYNNIKSTLPSNTSCGILSKKQKFNRKVIDILTALGLNQVMTYSFIGLKDYNNVLLNDKDCVKILNPLGEETSIMKSTSLPSLLEVLARNYRNGIQEAKLFEISKEYKYKNNKKNVLESNKLIAGFYGKDINFLYVQNVAEEFLLNFDIKFDLRADIIKENNYRENKLNRIFAIDKKGIEIAEIYSVNPIINEKYEINQNVYIIEVNLDYINIIKKSYKEFSKFPLVSRDISLICNINARVVEIESFIKDAAGKVLENLELFDIYKDKQLEREGKKSLAYRLTFRSEKRTLKEEEINNIIKKIIEKLKEKGINLRS